MTLRGILSVVSLVAVMMAAGPAGADRASAREAYREAMKRYDLNEYDAALASFKKAYLEFEDPALLFNIAQCHRQLGNKPEAIGFYRSFLRKLPDAPNQAEVLRLIDMLEASVAEERALKAAPPADAVHATQPVASPAPLASAPPQIVDHERRRPIYKQWWLWTAVGVVVAGGVVTAAVLATRPSGGWSNVGEFGPGVSNKLVVRW